MAFDSKQITSWFDKAAGSDEEKAQRMIDALATLDEAFGGDPIAIGSALKLLGGVAKRVKSEVQLGVVQREIQELQNRKQAISLTAQQELTSKLNENQEAITAKAQIAAQIMAEIEAINRELPDRL